MFSLLLRIYGALYTTLLVFYLLFFAYRAGFQGRSWSSLLQRFRPLPSGPGETPREIRIWVHAVSVGEVKAVKPLLDRLAPRVDRMFVSTITETGHALARTLFEGQARVFYFPLDWRWLCRRTLQAVEPAAVLLAETEIWPSFITTAASLKIPVLLVNGRLSEGSFRRYRRIRFFLRPLLQRISHFCMQSRPDKERILELGADPDRVNQLGNLKYDYQLPDDPGKKSVVRLLARTVKPQAEDLLWVCGSTREGEEELLLGVFRRLAGEFPTLRLLLAPRHPHRVPSVCRLLERQQWSYCLRSSLSQPPPQAPRVLVLDSIGELAFVYQLADIVFVGGSLFPTGGQNIIEAAFFGKPILFGPHMENFQEVARAFTDSYAALQVRSSSELFSKIRDLLQDPAARQWLGRNARKVIRDNEGSVGRTLEIVQQYLSRAAASGKNHRQAGRKSERDVPEA